MMKFYRETVRKSIAESTGTTRIGRIVSPASSEFSPQREPIFEEEKLLLEGQHILLDPFSFKKTFRPTAPG